MILEPVQDREWSLPGRLEADCLVSSDKRFQPVEDIDVLASSDLRI